MANKLLNFPADKQQMTAMGISRRKEIRLTALFHLHPTAQVGNAHGEVAYGKIGSVDSRQGTAQLLLVERRNRRNFKLASGEAGYVFI